MQLSISHDTPLNNNRVITMVKISVVLVCAVILSGCEGGLEKSIRSQLKDPESAQFKEKITYMDWACISVNAKNSYGGYIGFKQYTMKKDYGDSWKTVSDSEYCSKETLVESEKQDKLIDTAEAKIDAAVEAQVLTLLKEKKLIPATADRHQILDKKCAEAADHAITAGALAQSVRYPNNHDSFKSEFEKRMDALKQGSCEIPPGLTNG